MTACAAGQPAYDRPYSAHRQETELLHPARIELTETPWRSVNSGHPAQVSESS